MGNIHSSCSLVSGYGLIIFLSTRYTICFSYWLISPSLNFNLQYVVCLRGLHVQWVLWSKFSLWSSIKYNLLLQLSQSKLKSFGIFIFYFFFWFCLRPLNTLVQVLTGDQILATLEYDNVKMWAWLLVLIGMILFFRIVFYLLLRFANKGKRWRNNSGNYNLRCTTASFLRFCATFHKRLHHDLKGCGRGFPHLGMFSLSHLLSLLFFLFQHFLDPELRLHLVSCCLANLILFVPTFFQFLASGSVIMKPVQQGIIIIRMPFHNTRVLCNKIENESPGLHLRG